MRKISLMWIWFISSFFLYSSGGDINLGGSNKYKAFRLTSEIYKNSNRDFSGIYIKDSKNENIPYILLSQIESVEYLKDERELVLINTFKKEQDFYLDYRVRKIEEKDIIGTSLEFSLGAENFFRNIELYGSHDNNNWVKIVEDTLYRTPQGEKGEIVFNKEEKYTFFRLKLKNNLEKIALENSKLIQSKKNESLNYFTDTIDTEFQIKNEESITTIEIEALKNLKIESIEILTDDFFKRRVSTSMNQSKILYNLEVGSEKNKDTRVNFYGRYLEDNLKIYIENNADKALNVKAIRVTYYFDYLVFELKNSSELKLEFSEEDKNKPFYDMEYYKSDILKEKIDIVNLKNIVIDEKIDDIKVDKKTLDFKLIFNIVISIVGLLICVFILKNISKSRK